MGKFVPITERIKRNSNVDEYGCWIWQGPPTNTGYGHMSIRENGRVYNRLAHRVSYQAHVEPIPDGLTIDHLCRVRLCVNPAHLEPVTPRENVMRAPLAQAALNAAKTHCPQGHEYTEANTYVHGGDRRCRTCLRDRRRAYRSVTKGA